MSEAGSVRPPRLTLSPALAGRVRVGTLLATPIVVTPTTGTLDAEIESCRAGLRERFAGRPPAAIDDLAAARELYRTFGIDPTKTRPSSEKLLRRVLRGQSLPRISNAVDLANLLAIRLLLPIGLFDAEKITGDVELRTGATDESYEGIAGQRLHLGGRPVLADDRGAFGNPTADSRRTSVAPTTTTLWLTVFAPASYPGAQLERRMGTVAEALAGHLAGDEPVHTEFSLV